MENKTRLNHDTSLDYTIPPSSVVPVIQVIRTISGLLSTDGSLDYTSPEIIQHPVASPSKLPSVPKGIINDASFDYR